MSDELRPSNHGQILLRSVRDSTGTLEVLTRCRALPTGLAPAASHSSEVTAGCFELPLDSVSDVGHLLNRGRTCFRLVLPLYEFMHPVHEHNRHAWDERVRLQKPYIDTAGEKDFLNALAIADPGGWLGGEVAGKRLLCLAAGGGRHGALFAAAGAKVTVVDLSPQMLELDRKAAATRGLRLNIVEASMDDLSVLGDASFDIVVQPVSTCYVPDVQAVYREVARVLAAGGIYLSQHKQPVSLQAEFVSLRQARGYWLSEPYYRQGALSPAAQDSLHREAGTIEFLHRWEQLLGGLCRAGFVIEDLGEPRHADPEALPNSFGHRSYFAPPYVVIKARRTTSAVREELKPKLWMP